MRPTAKDLARAAGVSLATVDRVLNGRSGVRKKTVDAVNSAIQEIGFERNQVAATLARRRGYRFGFVLPKSGDEYLKEILARVTEVSTWGRAEMLEASIIRIDDHDPHKAARTLGRLSTEKYDGIAIMASETPQVRDAIVRMRERGLNTIALISNQMQEQGLPFIGIDSRSAGETAGRLLGRFCRGQRGNVIVVTETLQSRDSLERRLGFDAVLSRHYPELKSVPTLETHGDYERTLSIFERAFATYDNIVGIYLMGQEARAPLEALKSTKKGSGSMVIAHERTPSTEAALRDDVIQAIIAQDPGHLVRSAIRVLRANSENRPVLGSQERIRTEILISENL
ncbi:MAG: LacI family DNA-binding transcriptional regulator [Pseudomonadota bacterium]